ncbi:DUF6538 domain-containing protein [Siccirubricoccus sp. G192]|uniref:DUF6538 domain-containing protein n=1 Tax=Siccirubricoccus sp. G192 TaxID=2849651 RepID=UPI001C2BCFD5|nr:DUF6538 domain-containing protein [Siccirubricoccus sp. G192]MBV1796375.1 hypothetical protein [Siccirubricoccus sp. G192]
MTLVTCLHRHPKTGVYWVRRSAPPELRQAAGRRELLESLGTKNPQEAKRRLGPVAHRAEERFSALRLPGGTVTASSLRSLKPPPALTAAGAEGIAGRYARDQLSRSLQTIHATRAAEAAELLQSCRDNRELWLDALRERDWRGVGGLASDLVVQEGRPQPSPEELALLHHALVRALVQIFDVEIARLQGEWPPLVPPLTATSALLPSQPTIAPTRPGAGDEERQPDVTFNELLARYHEERRLKPKVFDELKGIAVRFEEVCGKDRMVRTIGKASVGRFKQAMLPSPGSGARDRPRSRLPAAARPARDRRRAGMRQDPRPTGAALRSIPSPSIAQNAMLPGQGDEQGRG